jgi:LPS-assembly lipoprotein
MQWSRRGVLLGALTLAGCGFHPLYAPRDQSGFDADLASIMVHTIADRQGQLLAIMLRDGLNPTGARVQAHYTLDVQVGSTLENIAIRADGTASRNEIAMTARFSLIDTKAKKVVLQGTTHAVSSFDVLPDNYASVVASQNAEERTVQEIGDDILTRLQLYVSKHRSAPAPS